jgi:hypothetical protein
MLANPDRNISPGSWQQEGWKENARLLKKRVSKRTTEILALASHFLKRQEYVKYSRPSFFAAVGINFNLIPNQLT